MSLFSPRVPSPTCSLLALAVSCFPLLVPWRYVQIVADQLVARLLALCISHRNLAIWSKRCRRSVALIPCYKAHWAPECVRVLLVSNHSQTEIRKKLHLEMWMIVDAFFSPIKGISIVNVVHHLVFMYFWITIVSCFCKKDHDISIFQFSSRCCGSGKDLLDLSSGSFLLFPGVNGNTWII